MSNTNRSTIVTNISNTIMSGTYAQQRTHMKQSDVEKLEQAIEVHGYRGTSKGKHNGVVNIKPDDTQLIKALEKFKSNNLNKEIYDTITKNSEVFIIDVKVVAHLPNGDRAVGSLYKSSDGLNLILYVFGFANYNHQLF